MSNLSGETVGEFDELFVGDNKYIHITNNNQLVNGAGYITSGGSTNVPTFPTSLGTPGQIVKLKSTPSDGFEYVDFPTLDLAIASDTTLGGVKINGNNLSIDSNGLLSATNTEYTAGTNISITNDVISATVPTQTSELTNNSNFITASSNINNTLIQTTRQEIIGDTQPQLYIRSAATSGRDATLTLEGRRNNNSNINSTYLKFTNFDDNDGANGSTAIVGMICGAVSNAADNTGRLRFYTSSTGSNAALCLSLDSDNSATFYGNVTFSNTPKDSSNYSYITTNSTNTLLNKSFTYDSISDPPDLFDGSYSSLSGLPDLFDGSYSSLSGKPDLFDGSYSSLSGMPDLFDGSYSSLSGLPDLFDGSYSSLSGKPDLFDGSYSSLSGLPDLFDGSYSSLSGLPDLFDGSYSSLSGLPDLFDGSYSSLSGLPDLFDGSYSSLSGLPDLFDGSYSSLSGLPDLFDGSYSSLSGKPDLFDGSYSSLSGLPDLFDGSYSSLSGTARFV